MSLHLVPISRATARDAVARWHRHNAPKVGDLFRVGIATDDGTLVAVGIASRPAARAFDDGHTVEVARVASDGTRNACSTLGPSWEPYDPTKRYAKGIDGAEPDSPPDRTWMGPVPTLPDPGRRGERI